MDIPEAALEAAAEAIGMNPEDQFSAEVFAHDGTQYGWVGHIRAVLASALEAAAPHMQETGDAR